MLLTPRAAVRYNGRMSNDAPAPIFAGKTDLRTLSIDELRQLVRMADNQWETLWTGPGDRAGVEMDAQGVLDLMVAADRAGWSCAESFVEEEREAGAAAWLAAQNAARARAGIVDAPEPQHIAPDLLTGMDEHANPGDGFLGW